MKRYILYVMLLITLPLFSCDARPVAVFEKTVHDFGKVRTDSSVKYTFSFRNAGNEVLVIERIKAG